MSVPLALVPPSGERSWGCRDSWAAGSTKDRAIDSAWESLDIFSSHLYPAPPGPPPLPREGQHTTEELSLEKEHRERGGGRNILEREGHSSREASG